MRESFDSASPHSFANGPTALTMTVIQVEPYLPGLPDRVPRDGRSFLQQHQQRLADGAGISTFAGSSKMLGTPATAIAIGRDSLLRLRTAKSSPQRTEQGSSLPALHYATRARFRRPRMGPRNPRRLPPSRTPSYSGWGSRKIRGEVLTGSLSDVHPRLRSCNTGCLAKTSSRLVATSARTIADAFTLLTDFSPLT